MKKPIIALLGQMDKQQAQDWQTKLQENLPDENIILYHDLSSIQRKQVEIAIVANPKPAELEALPSLKWIQSLWSGVERLVAEYKIDVPIVRMIDTQLSQSMAEAVLAWTMYLHREMPTYASQQKQKVWSPLEHKNAAEIKVSILGLGQLGRAALQLLHQVGYPLSGWSRSKKSIKNINTYEGEKGLLKMLSNTDILICLLPLTKDTKNLLNQQLFEQLPNGASIINFARGPIVNENDLMLMLDNKHIKHAVLDVFNEEPLPVENALWCHPAITILPHISAPSNINSASKTAAFNIQHFRQTGTIPRTINREKGY